MALFILVSLTMTLFREKVPFSNRCISGLMSNVIKKSWTVSSYSHIIEHITHYISRRQQPSAYGDLAKDMM